jgi:predicted MFS family arabinose efflux permease
VTLFMCVFCVGVALGSLLTGRVSGTNLELGLVPFGSLGPCPLVFGLVVRLTRARSSRARG